MNLDQQQYATSEGNLALALYLAGAQFSDPRLPLFHFFDPEILSKLGFHGMGLWNGAELAWKTKQKGHVEYSFQLNDRTNRLIEAFRDQKKRLEDKDQDKGQGEGKGSDFLKDLLCQIQKGSLDPEEGAVRIACLILTIRREFMNLWKDAIPLLKVPVDGSPKNFGTTARIQTDQGSRTVPAQGVKRPGYKICPMNATDATKKKLGLIP